MEYEQEEDDGWMDVGAEYSPKSEYSKAKVTEDVTRKCMELRAKEMKRGYFNTTFSKEGLPLKSWVEDSRKAYCSSVIALKRLLSPEILEDTKEGNYKHVDIDALFDDYAYEFLEQKFVNGKVKFVKSGKFYMPEMDEAVMIKKVFPDGNEQLVAMAGFWNTKVNAYWDNMVRRCDELFEELMNVIHRKNYFKQAVRWG